ncbi:MAG TPA: phosphoglycolate phosphatase [Gammaproteobacteria bacterium]|nr:phosphoglycolate phosphatase [Gammaproteobacteria bacterium]
MTLRAVLFDFDGTLADTAPDMSAAINRLRVENGLEPLAYDRLRPWVSHGSPGLLKIAFGLERDAEGYGELRDRFLALYESRLSAETKLFDGMQAVLDGIVARGLAWGIVTNKPAWLTDPLVADMAIAPAPGCVVSGDTTAHHKPHPAPILHACECLGVAPAECVYIGDAERDIQAAHAAGMPAIAARYGYLQADEDPSEWRPDAIIDAPGELLDWLARNLERES